jgi:hypothetical protein
MSEFIIVRSEGKNLGILVTKITPVHTECVIAAIMTKTKEEAGENWSMSDAVAALSDAGVEFNWYPTFGYIDL